MASFQERLEEGLRLRDMTPAELAKRTGIGEGAISQYRKGAYKASQRNLEKIAAALTVSIPWLMGVSDDYSLTEISRRPVPSNIIPMPQTYQVPLLGKIACGQPILAVEEAEETVEVPSWIKADFALQCQGDSMMGARILDGDVVYIRAQDTVENGQIAAVLIKDNGTWEENATLKRYYQHPGLISLRAANPSYPDMDYVGEDMSRVRVLGLVVGFTSTTIK